ELGCCCKDDLGTAHKQCAEVWFRIKGTQICGSTAQNVAAEYIVLDLEDNNNNSSSSSMGIAQDETEALPDFGRAVASSTLSWFSLAFIASWLFHFHL
ncbi:hypothetical protein M569_09808, partial [Genlisea aurea]